MDKLDVIGLGDDFQKAKAHMPMEKSIHVYARKWAERVVTNTSNEGRLQKNTCHSAAQLSSSPSVDIVSESFSKKSSRFVVRHMKFTKICVATLENTRVQIDANENFDTARMTSETYLRRARGSNSQLGRVDETHGYFDVGQETEKSQPAYTINTVHLQNPYQSTQKFDGYGNPQSQTQLRPTFVPKNFEGSKRSKMNIPIRNDLTSSLKNDELKRRFYFKRNNLQNCWKKLHIADMTTQYASNSTLHGLRYLGDMTLSITEKLFWMLAFFCAFLSATYFIWNLYQKWQASPIIISISPEPVSFEEFPFPSITICNMNNAKRSEASRINKGNNGLEKLLLEDICNFKNNSEDYEVYGSADWENVLQFMLNVSHQCPDLLHYCEWHGNLTDCERLFNPTMTDEGLCCNFNSVHKKYLFYNPLEWSDLNITFPYNTIDWKPEAGYSKSALPDDQPWRPYGAGKYLGLTLVLDVQLSEYYCSSTSSAGFKMLLHSPIETPKIADFGFALSPGKETHIIISPKISAASWSILSLPRNKRKCFFTTERKLHYYRTYTQRNCLLECEATFTQKICQCVQYYMPKSKNTPICGKKDDDCARSAKLLMETRLYDDGAAIDKLNITETPSCNCWPACFEINYEFHTSESILSTGFHVDEAFIKKNQKYFTENMAVVHLYFVESQFQRYVKSELFGFIEFLSNIGGLLGLFMGFSFLSVVEIFYFITLRLWCRYTEHNIKSQNTTSLVRVQAASNIVYPFSQ